MNHQRHHTNRQNNGYGYQGNGSQHHRSQQSDPNRWERENLEREQRQLQHQLSMLEARIDALGAQGAQLDADMAAHHAAIPATVAAEVGRAIASAIRLPYLPSAARGWYYKRERMLQLKTNLQHLAITLHAQREALVQQIEQIHIDIDLLKYHV
jgi:hypothetical protein